MTGIQFVTDDKGHRVAVQIDLRKRGTTWQDFWDELISEAPKEKGITYVQFRAGRSRRSRPRG